MGWYILGLIIALAFQIYVATRFASIAEEKGYNGNSYFWLCFLLGIVGYCMVAALPDVALYNKIDNLSKSIQDAVKTEEVRASNNCATDVPSTASKPSVGNWICENCGTSNSLNYGQCKKCGEFKS